MKLSTLTALLLVAFVTTFAQEEGDKCITPDQWEGFEVRVEPSQGKYNGSMRRSYLSYDAVNMKVNRMDEDRNSSGSARYRDIYLFNEKVAYRINLNTKPPTCERSPLTESFRKIGVPSVDTLSYKAIIGTDAVFGAGVEVNGYAHESDRGRSVTEWIQPGEGKQCVPAFESYVSRTTGAFSYTSFYNISLGIKDPTVFIPPFECNPKEIL